MSDIMLLGVLRQPLPDDPAQLDAITWAQIRGRMRQAADRIEREGVCGLSGAAQDVLAERSRQINEEGWSHDHDDDHADGDLAAAAACYAIASSITLSDTAAVRKTRWRALLDLWPWGDLRVGTVERRMLVKAGALVLAEIERRDRAAITETT